jgi:hypothetical protein
VHEPSALLHIAAAANCAERSSRGCGRSRPCGRVRQEPRRWLVSRRGESEIDRGRGELFETGAYVNLGMRNESLWTASTSPAATGRWDLNLDCLPSGRQPMRPPCKSYASEKQLSVTHAECYRGMSSMLSRHECTGSSRRPTSCRPCALKILSSTSGNSLLVDQSSFHRALPLSRNASKMRLKSAHFGTRPCCDTEGPFRDGHYCLEARA